MIAIAGSVVTAANWWTPCRVLLGFTGVVLQLGLFPGQWKRPSVSASLPRAFHGTARLGRECPKGNPRQWGCKRWVSAPACQRTPFLRGAQRGPSQLPTVLTRLVTALSQLLFLSCFTPPPPESPSLSGISRLYDTCPDPCSSPLLGGPKPTEGHSRGGRGGRGDVPLKERGSKEGLSSVNPRSPRCTPPFAVSSPWCLHHDSRFPASPLQKFFWVP